jgi:hypothetical protein
MKKLDNPELSRRILNHLADQYKIKEKREGIHLSTLIYCLTRSFFDQQAPVEPTDEEVMLFALGLGLQDVLTPSESFTPVYNKDGVLFSPDFVFSVKELKTAVLDASPSEHERKDIAVTRLVELKTTRMSSGKEDLPETWLEYIMGGCYMRGANTYDLSVLHMLGNYKPPFPEIRSYRLEFAEDELRANWDYLMERRAVYEEALKTGTPPVPFSYCKDWECKNCRYKLQCQAMDMLAKEREESKDA